METAPLKSFATSARSELIREVTARITAVLAQGSPERVEQPKAVSALERAIAAGGGGDIGKAHVADKVAYTWFNRIIALRFMDANGYTGIGVVSPATDQVGQPEVLAAAKRGQVDADVVKGASATTTIGLLNGTRQPRPGVDAQAEAYSLLLAEYCRFWNRAMPFMFEREGDYTELLIPANLLADDSVLRRSVTVLTEDVCQDVELIGWLYQFYISERKAEVFAGFKDKKAGADEIPAATQLFTPHWIVRYIVENSLGRLWMLNRPSSGLVNQMEYYIAPVDEETDFLKITRPEELKVIDPACGSGHMLTYAFDLLYAIYEEEGYAPSEIPGLILTHNLYGTEIDPRAGALAAFALTMKAVAKRKLFFKNPVEPNICVLDPISFTADELSYLVTTDGDRPAEEAFWNHFAEADTYGSLITPDRDLIDRLARHLDTLKDGGDMYKADAISWAWRAIRQAKFLSPRYCIALANPPYMGSKNMGDLLVTFVRHEFAGSKADLFACFISRCRSLVVSKGLVGMITMQSWMFLQSFEAMRQEIVRGGEICTLAHLGAGAFDSIGGDVVSTVAFVLCAEHKGRTTFLRLTSAEGEDAKASLLLKLRSGGEAGRYDLDLASFQDLPGAPLSYWLEPHLVAAFKTSDVLQRIAPVCQGLATADSARFVRAWVEVSLSDFGIGLASREVAKATGRRWFPENKGGTSRRWYGNQWHVLDWKDDGAELFALRPKSVIRNPQHYFKPSVSWSAVGASNAFRYYPAGFIFDNAGMSVIPPDDDTAMYLLGCLNSSVMSEIVSALAPTMNLNAGTVAQLPIPQGDRVKIASAARAAVETSRLDWVASETSWEFSSSVLVVEESTGGLLAGRVKHVQHEQEVRAQKLAESEALVDDLVAGAFGLSKSEAPRRALSSGLSKASTRDLVTDLVSYAVGCMFGRYGLDKPGLILADQGATLQDYLAKVPSPTFMPDPDNVIPIVNGDWFEDDIVGRFRQFLRAAFGREHFEENLQFVIESLGVRNLRDYFITRAGRSRFYDEHVQRYKKRPIYWLFSSPKGTFNALLYMHRYTPSTVSTVLTYLREYVTKLESSLQQAERAGNAKEADRLRKILVELNQYEHDTLYPLASQNVVIDLGDGVRANYLKFGSAMRKITGLEASGD